MGIEPKSILLIQTAFLGDVVLTTPLFHALRDRFPKARLVVLAIPSTRDILEGHPDLDEVVIHDKKGGERGIGGIWAAVGRIRAGGFDACLLPHRSFRSALIAFLAGIPVRIGFLQSPAAWLYTKRVPWRKDLHEARRNLELLRPLGGEFRGPSPPLRVACGMEDRREAERFLASFGIGDAERLIGMAPGSVWATKRWTPEGFAAVADQAAERFGRRVVLLGSPDDLPTAEAVLARCRNRPLNLVGQTGLRRLAALMKRCDLMITNDNGAMHIAVAQGVPVVAIFGSTTPGLGYGPFSDRASVVERDLDCRPCGTHGHRECPLGHFRCMTEITPDAVMAEVERIMGGGSRE